MGIKSMVFPPASLGIIHEPILVLGMFIIGHKILFFIKDRNLTVLENPDANAPHFFQPPIL